MGKIGILCAVELEMLPYRRVLKKLSICTKAGLEFYTGVIDNIEVVVLCSGVGKVNAANATQLLIKYFKVNNIIVSGTAGALDPRLCIGDTIISTDTIYYDVEMTHLITNYLRLPHDHILADKKMLKICHYIVDNRKFSNDVYFGKILTSDTYVNQDRKQLFNRDHAMCVDMETASIAHVCSAFNIPFIAIRSVSDTGIDMTNQLSSFFRVSKNSFIIVKELLQLIDNPINI